LVFVYWYKECYFVLTFAPDPTLESLSIDSASTGLVKQIPTIITPDIPHPLPANEAGGEQHLWKAAHERAAKKVEV
jgi:hypothetical protein